jgi:tetratricopeptide (TPR) repeat protein
MSKTGIVSLCFCGLLLACGSGQPSATSPDTVDPAEDEAGPAHGAPGSPITLESLARSAVLFDNLGAHHRRVTTTSPEAQAYFDQGLRLLYGFNHDEATRSFARAAELDPACAMCFWGASLTLGPNYNVPMLPERSVMAWEALEKARAGAARGAAVEQALIGALTARYKGPEPLSPEAMQPYNIAFANQMRQVAARYPGDMDVQVLFAESLMDVNPWKLWSLDGKPAPGTEEIVTTLERVLAAAPDHPGANHYYIHAVEASWYPWKALPSAERLASLMPGAGHMVHMPAHIFQRVGRYADASRHNRMAIEADLAYMSAVEPWGYYAMYLGHNYGFLSFSASMEGRSQESLKAALDSAKALPPSMLAMMPGMDFFAAEPLLAMVRFGQFDALLAEPRPDPRYQVLTAFWLHGHGMALAAKGRLEEATADLAELVKLAEAVRPEVRAGNNEAKDVMDVAARVLGARIAEKKGDAAALAMWAEAVAKADTLAYSEPADWFYPVRHYQGAALLAAAGFAEAEAVYREDLKRNPANGWALFGLSVALKAQKKTSEAARIEADFMRAWARADIKLTTTAF